jgi:hypothetical protein
MHNDSHNSMLSRSNGHNSNGLNSNHMFNKEHSPSNGYSSNGLNSNHVFNKEHNPSNVRNSHVRSRSKECSSPMLNLNSMRNLPEAAASRTKGDHNISIKTKSSRRIAWELYCLIIIWVRLIHSVRCYQVKFRYLHIKYTVIYQAGHLVFAFHAAHISLKITARYIFMGAARFNNGLLTHYAFALYFPLSAVGVENLPVPA